jgi:hypothetical protein
MKAAELIEDPWPDWLMDRYEPRSRWRDDPATEKQKEALRNRGYDPPRFITKGEAAWVLDLASPRQVALLRRRGLWHPGQLPLKSEEAREMIDSLAAREGWKRRVY